MNGYDPSVQAAQARAEWNDLLNTIGRFRFPEGHEESRDEMREALETVARVIVTAEVLGEHDVLTPEEMATLQADLYEVMETMVGLRDDLEMLMDRIAAFRQEA